MNEEICFTATEVNCYVEDDVTSIGIGDDAVSPDHFIILSRFDEEDEDVDNTIGLMTHLSDIEAINTIKKIILVREKMVISLASQVGITINLSIEDSHFNQLHDYLLQILQGSSISFTEE